MERMLCLKKILLSLPTAVLVISGLVLCGCDRDSVSATPAEPPTESTNGGRLYQNLGRAEGEIQEAVPDGSGNLELPKVWLVFAKSAGGEVTNTKVELPADAELVLSGYWKFLFTVKKDTDLLSMVEVKNEARRSLLKTKIDAPEGRRGIAFDESSSLLDYLADEFIRRRDGVSRQPALELD